VRSPKEAAVEKLVLRLLQAIYSILDIHTLRFPEEIERAYEEMYAVLEELGVKTR